MSVNKFLKLFFGCHQKPERSFFYKGKQFPICARCTGLLVGMILGVILAIFFNNVRWYLAYLLMLPCIIEGIIQYNTSYLSTNYRRLLLGILCGVGIIYNFVNIYDSMRFFANLLRDAIY